MIKIILIALSAILIGLVIIYSWFNRDSDRVVLTLITAMTISALGFITKESISNKVEQFHKEMPVAVFYGLPNYRLLNIKLPYSFDLDMCMQNIDPKDIPVKDKEVVDIDFAQNKYFDAVQYIVITTIFKRFAQSWNVKAKRTHTPNGESLSWQYIAENGKEITISEFFKKIPNNYFVKLGLHKDLPEPFGGKAMLPPDTEITIDTNEGDHKLHISLATKYITLNIVISKATSSIGVGEYSKLFGMPSALDRRNAPDTDKYGNSVYLLEVSAIQKYLLNGHPEMKKHRNWADSIAELLDSTFNYEHIRENHMRQFQLYGPDAIRNL